MNTSEQQTIWRLRNRLNFEKSLDSSTLWLNHVNNLQAAKILGLELNF